MKIYAEKSLRDFEFWGGAEYTRNNLTLGEIDTIECVLEEIYPDGASETTINDIFWFEEDWIAEMLGFEDWEALERDHNGEEE